MTGFGGNQAPDPFSKNSRERGLIFKKLPDKGCTLRIPNWPLPPTDDKQVNKRERDIWISVWKTPQATQWHKQHWRWQEVAEYCRTLARFEQSGSSAMGMLVERQRTSIGLNAQGLRANGWIIESMKDELRDKRSYRHTASKADFKGASREIDLGS